MESVQFQSCNFLGLLLHTGAVKLFRFNEYLKTMARLKPLLLKLNEKIQLLVILTVLLIYCEPYIKWGSNWAATDYVSYSGCTQLSWQHDVIKDTLTHTHINISFFLTYRSESVNIMLLKGTYDIVAYHAHTR